MRSVFILALLVSLVSSDESNDVTSSSDELSNWPTPCSRISNVKAFSIFVHKNIIQYHFDVTQTRAWADYLTKARICGTQPHHSFLEKTDTQALVQICRGHSVRDERNLCVSRRKFRVFVVQSVMRHGHCHVQLQIERAHVVVACEYIHSIRCVPVHLAEISYTVPRGHQCE